MVFHTDRTADSLQSAMFKAKDGPISMTLRSSAKEQRSIQYTVVI